MKAGWVFPFIIAGGILQSCGAAMNCQYRLVRADHRLFSMRLRRSSDAAAHR